VLLHCSQGVSRSATLAIAYRMWRHGETYDDAFRAVKAARGVVNPNIGFTCQVGRPRAALHAVPASR
jgi:protein-tyrosine phosphatase